MTPRSLPAVGTLLGRPAIQALVLEHGRERVAQALRLAIDDLRAAILAGERPDVGPQAVEHAARESLSRPNTGLRPVLNATGIVLHTGLGRSPLASEAIAAVAAVASGYCDLEFLLETGERGRRGDRVASLLKQLTGAESAAVANNNAAATILALRALALGREVIVSRGQLVEIGGSFRLPEIMEASGAKLREVGTTNRTRLADYERAIGPDTAAILRVHPSNYRVVGFTESVEIRELAKLGHDRGLSVIDDVGSGLIARGRLPFTDAEPTVEEGIEAGADLVLFSGDKLLGGPQCGILAGRAESVARVAADPLMRAVRVDKVTLAALEATLLLMLDSELAAEQIPLARMLGRTCESLWQRASELAERIGRETGLTCVSERSESYLGGGSLPGEAISSAAVRVGPPWYLVRSESEMARRLRLGDPAVVPRVQGGSVVLDLRAIEPGDDDRLARAVAVAAGAG